MRNFNGFYQEIMQNESNDLEEIRKNNNKNVLQVCVIILIAILLMSFLPPIFIPIVIVALIIFSISKLKNNKKYVREYKQRIINKMIKEFKEYKVYEPARGIASRIYKNADFESFDIYNSEDLIEGIILEKYPIKLAEVHTQDESEDSDGNRTIVTLFHGIFAQIEMPTLINGYVQIHSDKGFIGKIFKGKTKIEMDSSEFEKHFDVYATDKILGMQILTSDVMQMIMEFIETYKVKYEMTVKGSSIFIRFKTGPVFEPGMFKKALDYKRLKEYYDILQLVIRVSETIIKAMPE